MPINDAIAYFDPADAASGLLPNKAGSGNAIISGSPTLQAGETFSYLALGDLDAIRFSVPSAPELTLCYFIRVGPAAATAGYHHLFTFDSDQLQGLFKRTNEAIAALNLPAGGVYFYGPGVSASTGVGLSLAIGEWRLLTLQVKGDKIRAWKDGIVGGDKTPMSITSGLWSIGRPDSVGTVSPNEYGEMDVGPIRLYDRFLTENDILELMALYDPNAESPASASQVSGVVKIDGAPARRTVRAFGYDPIAHAIDGVPVNQSKSLGHAVSNEITGEYSIDLLEGYASQIFVVAFDDYGSDFSANMAVSVGDRVHPTTPNGHVFECMGAGALPAEEPAWIIDTETPQLYGTASMLAKPFYRPMVHGPVAPQVTLRLFPTQGLVSYWAFNDGAGAKVSDAYGQNPGSLDGSPAWITASALGSNAVDFSTGTAPRMNTGVMIGGNMDWSFSVWAKKTGSADNRIILSAVRTPTNYFLLIHRSDKNGLCIQRQNSAGVVAQYVNTGFSLTAEKYHHVVWTKQGTTHRIYIDNVLKVEAEVAIGGDYGFDTGEAELIIGNQAAAYSSLSWAGPLDEFAFYNQAIDSATVRTLYSNGTPSDLPFFEEGPAAPFPKPYFLSAGGSHTLAINETGQIIGWGTDNYGQATAPAGTDNPIWISAGNNFSLAVLADNTVIGFGFNGNGEINIPAGLAASQVSAGRYHSLALKTDGTVASWGFNGSGQTTVPAISDVIAVAAGRDHSVALFSSGAVTCWGANGSGQSTPPPGLTNVVAIAAGRLHTAALKSDGSVVCWGSDANNQVTPPAGLADVVAISCGDLQTFALKSDGTVVGWGFNGNGEIDIPAGLADVIGIEAGDAHSVAVTSTGSVVCWGSDANGRATPPAGLIALTP